MKAPTPIVPLAAEHISTLTTSQTNPLSDHIQHPSRRLTSKALSIYTLFHTRSPLLSDVRNRVLSQVFQPTATNVSSSSLDTPETPTYDTISRNSFDFIRTDREDTHASLSKIRLTGRYALHDTHSGARIASECFGRALLERILDLIMLDRVEFDQLLDCVAQAAAEELMVELVNYGPGTGLARVAMRALKERVTHASIVFNDVSSSGPSLDRRPAKPSQEPIAIVGMAVNLPGARNTEELWRILEHGINTVEEVLSFFFICMVHCSPFLFRSRALDLISPHIWMEQKETPIAR